MNLKLSFLLAVCFTSVFCMPNPKKFKKPDNPLLSYPTEPTTRYNVTDPMKLFGPDVILNEEQMKSGLIGENFRWRGGFYVQVDRRFNDNEFNIINAALYDLHVNLCIDVLMWPQDANPSGDYVFIERGGDGSGCWSFVGKQGGRQVLNLQANGCVHQGTATHEAIHALGFFHEQSRPDRDNHVNVLWQNISPDMAYNFNALTWGEASTYDVPYDYVSIMHYNAKDFSNNGGDTLQAKDGRALGSRGVMTNEDKTKLRRMYNC